MNHEVKEDWAILQVKSSQDYAQDSFWTTYLSGALNFQIEHHLFPGISQAHYPAIAPLVKKQCEKYGIPYLTKSSFWEAFRTHLNLLYKMS